jgi:hypothetical protein
VSPVQPSTRLYAILARKSPKAVVFRRGPSKQVLVLGWDTESHEFRLGQWFKGRVYEQRCDVSPSGEKLIYFAAKYRAPHFTWTAVNRPPFLTALALWPKGDAWGGGGLFKDERTILLNHRANEMQLAEDFRFPKAMRLEAMGDHSGGGEDDPIHSIRLVRDGWVLKRKGKRRENKFGSKIWFEFVKPRTWTKTRGPWTLEMRLLGIKERDGPWYLREHVISNAGREVVLSFGRSDWADWSRSGEVLFAEAGPGTPEELIDLRSLSFEPIEAPPEAKKWIGQPAQGRAIR